MQGQFGAIASASRPCTNKLILMARAEAELVRHRRPVPPHPPRTHCSTAWHAALARLSSLDRETLRLADMADASNDSATPNDSGEL